MDIFYFFAFWRLADHSEPQTPGHCPRGSSGSRRLGRNKHITRHYSKPSSPSTGSSASIASTIKAEWSVVCNVGLWVVDFDPSLTDYREGCIFILLKGWFRYHDVGLMFADVCCQVFWQLLWLLRLLRLLRLVRLLCCCRGLPLSFSCCWRPAALYRLASERHSMVFKSRITH